MLEFQSEGFHHSTHRLIQWLLEATSYDLRYYDDNFLHFCFVVMRLKEIKNPIVHLTCFCLTG
jgi:hypothetical protein